MAYHTFDPNINGRQLNVTIGSKGRIILNAAVTRLFKSQDVEHVLLLWDAQGPTIGIQPTPKEPRSFKIGFAAHNATIYAPAFLEYVHAHQGTFPATWNGLLEFVLDREIVRRK